MMIQSTWDIATARNVCRKVILGQKLSPTLCGRAVAVVAVLGELILLSQMRGSLDVREIPQQGKRGIEIRCSLVLVSEPTPSLETTRSQLERVVDALHVHVQDNLLEISAHIWPSDAILSPLFG